MEKTGNNSNAAVTLTREELARLIEHELVVGRARAELAAAQARLEAEQLRTQLTWAELNARYGASIGQGQFVDLRTGQVFDDSGLTGRKGEMDIASNGIGSTP